MRGLFITATDTDVGKTVIAASLARLWRREGRRFAVCKPVATGARLLEDGRLLADDTRRLAAAAGDPHLEQITPHVYAEPAAPPLAARLAGETLTLDQLAAAVERRATGGTPVLVEGVGGLLCPLTEEHTVADLVARLGLPLLVVARRALGTLNHTLLTLEVARRRGLPVSGVVITETTPPAGAAEADNVEQIRRRAGVPVLAVVPHQSGGDEVEIANPGAIQWWSLID